MRELGHDPYAIEHFERTDTAQGLLDRFEEFSGQPISFAGRLVSYRLMGKAGFAHISDGDAKIQAYFKKDDLGEQGWELYNLLDIGDISALRANCSLPKRARRQSTQES